MTRWKLPLRPPRKRDEHLAHTLVDVAEISFRCQSKYRAVNVIFGSEKQVSAVNIGRRAGGNSNGLMTFA